MKENSPPEMRTRCELIGGGELTTRNENQVQVVEPSVAASCKPRCGGDLMTMECRGSRFTIQEDKEKGLTINFVTTKVLGIVSKHTILVLFWVETSK